MATRPAVHADPVPIDPDAGIPDLIRRLVDDSKRLAQDEVRLAKIELRESAHHATRGGIWLGIAAGAGLIAVIALTVCLAAVIGRLLNFHYWAGTLIVAVLELAVGAFFVLRGLKTIRQQSFTLPETRRAAAETARWAKSARAHLADDVRDRPALLTGQTRTQRTGRLGGVGAARDAQAAGPRFDGPVQTAVQAGAAGPPVVPADGIVRHVEIPIERRD